MLNRRDHQSQMSITQSHVVGVPESERGALIKRNTMKMSESKYFKQHFRAFHIHFCLDFRFSALGHPLDAGAEAGSAGSGYFL